MIHKLEYFLNARIVGTQIRARAWELLIAMLAMEAASASRAWWPPDLLRVPEGRAQESRIEIRELISKSPAHASEQTL